LRQNARESTDSNRGRGGGDTAGTGEAIEVTYDSDGNKVIMTSTMADLSESQTAVSGLSFKRGRECLLRSVLPAAIILSVVIFHVRTRLPNYYWAGSDIGLYLIHARNIVRGHPYSESLFVINPRTASESPQSYPPLYPVLLAPLYRAFGVDIQVFKLLNVVFFALALIAFFLLTRSRMGFSRSSLLLVAVGFLPLYWETKDMLLPDIPFMALSLWALLFGETLYRRGWNRTHPALSGFLAALLITLAYSTRSMGAIIAVAVLSYDVLRDKRVSLFAVSLGLGFSLGVLLVRLIGHKDNSYFVAWQSTPHHYLSNVVEYIKSLAYLFAFEERVGPPTLLLLAVTAGLAIVGLIARMRTSILLMEVYFVLFLLMLIAWSPGVGIRYLVPIVPIYLYYVFEGVPALDTVGPQGVSVVVLTLLVGVLSVNYAARYRYMLPRLEAFDPNSYHTDSRFGLLQREFRDLCLFLHNKTQANDGFLFENPRLLAFLAERRAAKYSPPGGARTEWADYRKLGITHLVLTKGCAADSKVMRPLVDSLSTRTVYSNHDYAVYQVLEDGDLAAEKH
jgi:hypothetical protein